MKLIKASFGSFMKAVDVTHLLKDKIGNKILVDGFGIPDPDPGVIKFLDITYIDNNGEKIQEKIIGESQFPSSPSDLMLLLRQANITDQRVFDLCTNGYKQIHRNHIILTLVDFCDKNAFVLSIPNNGAGIYCYVNYYVWAINCFKKSGFNVSGISTLDGFSLYKDKSSDDVYKHLFVKDQNNYFAPNDNIKQKIGYLKTKYNITPANCIGVVYRGTDKRIERPLVKVEKFVDKVQQLLKNESILLQTDEEPVCNHFKNQFGDRCVVFDEVPRSNNGENVFHGKIDNRLETVAYFDASIRIISSCKFVIADNSNIIGAMKLYGCQNIYMVG